MKLVDWLSMTSEEIFLNVMSAPHTAGPWEAQPKGYRRVNLEDQSLVVVGPRGGAWVWMLLEAAFEAPGALEVLTPHAGSAPTAAAAMQAGDIALRSRTWRLCEGSIDDMLRTAAEVIAPRYSGTQARPAGLSEAPPPAGERVA